MSTATTTPAYVITEGVSGTWFYHWSPRDKTTWSLCGRHVMATLMPTSAWGLRSHLGERYCEKCAALRETRLAAGAEHGEPR